MKDDVIQEERKEKVFTLKLKRSEILLFLAGAVVIALLVIQLAISRIQATEARLAQVEENAMRLEMMITRIITYMGIDPKTGATR